MAFEAESNGSVENPHHVVFIGKKSVVRRRDAEVL